MSTLAERMIRRTRAPLSAVEPLFASRFSAAYSEAPAAKSSSDDVSYEMNALNSQKISENATSLPSSQRRMTQAADSSDYPDAIRPIPAAPADSEIGQREDLPRTLSTANIRHSGRDKLLRTDNMLHAFDERRTSIADGAAQERERSNAGGNTNVATSQKMESPGAQSNAEALPFRAKAVSTARNRQERDGLSGLEASTSTPEVVISIGHIEVHAPQAPERPRRQEFRPRTSLSDFLNQSNGERR